MRSQRAWKKLSLCSANGPKGNRKGNVRIEELECRQLLSGYTFVNVANFGTTGLSSPREVMVADSSGDIFGVSGGGATGNGAIWEHVANSAMVIPIASFDGANTGTNPNGGLFMDASGDLFGVCSQGGANGLGTVWELANGSNAITALASFDSASGSVPVGQIWVDPSGNVWGTNQGEPDGPFGNVWEYDATSQMLSDVADFTAGLDGGNPHGGLVSDSAGHLFGTTFNEGTTDNGTVWEFTIGGPATIMPLASFDGSTTGGDPEGGLAIDSSGDLFGTSQGNIDATNDANVWDLPAGSGTINTIAFFPTVNVPFFFGVNPEGAIFRDAAGDLFGTAEFGGTTAQGEAWEIPAGTATTVDLHNFVFSQGHDPVSNVVVDSIGDVFGTTIAGMTANAGTFFELVAPGNIPSTHLVFSIQPTTTNADGTFSANVQVVVEGARNQLAAFDSSPVTLQINRGVAGATLGGTVTVNAVNGVATFAGLTLDAGGSFTLKATDGALKAAISRPFIVPTVPQMVVAQEPGPVAAGAHMAPLIAVALEDQFGNLLLTNHSVMRLVISSGPAGGKLIGAAAVVSHGVASFRALAIDRAGTYTLVVTDGVVPAMALDPFTVSPLAAAKMAFLVEPPSTTANTVFDVQVEMLDRFGNLAAADSSTVTLLLGVHPRGSLLGGTASEVANAGVADFADLSLATAGTYTLTATDSVRMPAKMSTRFFITA